MTTEISVSMSPIMNFSFIDNSFYSINLTTGSFLLEVWGASGGDGLSGASKNIEALGGHGGYSRGVLDIRQQTTLYVYIGGAGTSHTTDSPVLSRGGFNGGGDSLERNAYGGGTGGGGSTDICTVKSEFNLNNGYRIRSDDSYRSRIIVAGGGGGSFYNFNSGNSNRIVSFGGYGGGIKSNGSGYGHSYGCTKSKCDVFNQGVTTDLSYNYVTGSDQDSTGIVGCGSSPNDYMNGAKPGSFGYGGNAFNSGVSSGGGGGGGWFGGHSGSSGSSPSGIGGAGGSGYVHISSHPLSTLGSSFILQDPHLFDGDSSMPCPTNECFEELGHHGNGYARFTLISDLSPPLGTICSCFHCQNPAYHIIPYIIIILNK